MDSVFLPKVSIITPSFNQAQFIEETILSVQRQDYPHIEHLVVDGGSTDLTLNILYKYNKIIKWVSEKDEGQTNAINKGFKMAKGDIIGWLNSDDIYFEGTISAVVQQFLEKPETHVVYGDFVYLDKFGRCLWKKRLTDIDHQILLFDDCHLGQPSVLFRNDIFEKVGYLDESLNYAIDLEFWLRLGFAGYNFVHLPKYLSGYRLHCNSKTIGHNKSLLKEEELVRRKYHKKAGSEITNYKGFRKSFRHKFNRLKRRAIQLWHQNYIEYPLIDTIIKQKVKAVEKS